MIPIVLDQYKPLRDVVFESLRDAILKSVLKPGERLMEIQLAEELGVSRTPIREAIRKLEQEGFVVIIPRKGAYVSEISLKDLNDVYEIRAALEGLAASLAAERATRDEIDQMEMCLVRETGLLDCDNYLATVESDIELHNLIYKAARNERLYSTLNNLLEQIYRARVASTALPGRKKKSLDFHRRIVESISEHDEEQAQRIAREHIESGQQAMLEHLSVNKHGR